MSGIQQQSLLGMVVAGWDHARKLNAFERRYLAWILLFQNETLAQETKY